MHSNNRTRSELPDEWRYEPLGLVIRNELQNGAFIKKPTRGKGVLFANVVDMYRGVQLDCSRLERIDVSEKDVSKYFLNGGDIVVVRSSLKREGIGQCCVVPELTEPVFFDCHLIRVAPDPTKLDPTFLSFFWRSEVGKRELIQRSKTTTMTTLNQAGLSSAIVPVPPLSEQQNIATLLSTVQRAIDRQERLIALTAELKKALMHKLFTEGIRGEPLKRTEIGPVPDSWTVTTLGELCKKPDGRIQTGPFGSILHKNEYQDVGTPIVNPVHLVNSQIDHTDVPRVGESAAQRLHRYRLKVNDLLFGRRGDIGRHAIVSDAEVDWFCGTGCFIVRVSDPRVDARFLNAYLSKERVISWLQSHATGVIMPNLSNKVLERLPICFPNRVEQTAIAAALRAVDAKALAHARIAVTLNDVFRTLLHRLMTAQIRVHDLDLCALDELAAEIAEVT